MSNKSKKKPTTRQSSGSPAQTGKKAPTQKTGERAEQKTVYKAEQKPAGKSAPQTVSDETTLVLPKEEERPLTKAEERAAEKTAKIEAKAAEKTAKIEEKAAKETAKASAMAAEKTAKIEAKAAKKAAKAAKKREKAEAKAAKKRAKLEAKEAKKAAKAEKRAARKAKHSTSETAPQATPMTQEKAAGKTAKQPEAKETGKRENVGKEKGKPYIEFSEVCKTYQMGDTVINAVDKVSFSICKGELAVILGASGAGKTTVLNILGGIDMSDSGRIVVDGKDVSALNEKSLIEYRRYDIGFVFQFYNLIQNLTAKENVELAVQICPEHLDVDETLEAVGLGERRDNFPSQLSGGEQQRVAIARALAKSPKLLLCDEPTGALDYVTGKKILALLQETCYKTGMTVVLITHNSAIAQIADRVIRMRSGKVESITVNDSPMLVEDIEW